VSHWVAPRRGVARGKVSTKCPQKGVHNAVLCPDDSIHHCRAVGPTRHRQEPLPHRTTGRLPPRSDMSYPYRAARTESNSLTCGLSQRIRTPQVRAAGLHLGFDGPPTQNPGRPRSRVGPSSIRVLSHRECIGPSPLPWCIPESSWHSCRTVRNPAGSNPVIEIPCSPTCVGRYAATGTG
jgi:hypothetical protein